MTNLSLLGINTETPGFYDDPIFIKFEKQNPYFLNEYNYFVTDKQYDTNYLSQAKHKINTIIKILFDELKKTNRKGACIDISTILMKILEKENIWCCQFGGCLTQKFPKKTGIQTNYFYLIDNSRSFSTPHAWIYAPPYKVIDLSISLQAYTQNEEKYLPPYVVEGTVTAGTITAKDIVNPKYANLYNATEDDILFGFMQHKPEMQEFVMKYSPFKIDYKNVSLNYIPVGAGAGSSELENITSINFSGMTPYELYINKIKPLII